MLLGSLHAFRATSEVHDLVFPPWDEQVMTSTRDLIRTMAHLYPINYEDGIDVEDRPLGPAVGRYPEDRYDGSATNTVGNPWLLASAAIAEQSYILAAYYAQRPIHMTAALSSFCDSFYNLPEAELDGERDGFTALQDVIPVGTDLHKRVLRRFVRYGDTFLRRLKLYVGADGDLHEQYDRQTGQMRGARQLTWSHTAFVRAVWSREEARARVF